VNVAFNDLYFLEPLLGLMTSLVTWP